MQHYKLYPDQKKEEKREGKQGAFFFLKERRWHNHAWSIMHGSFLCN